MLVKAAQGYQSSCDLATELVPKFARGVSPGASFGALPVIGATGRVHVASASAFTAMTITDGATFSQRVVRKVGALDEDEWVTRFSCWRGLVANWSLWDLGARW